MRETKITFGSLFAGIGGFDLGFERAGMQCRWQVEIDPYCQKVLAKHWPSVHRERDIKDCGKHNLEWVDVICGGFPCQDISYAGLGAGLDGERSGLFFEAIRVVRELRPRIVVLENVAALLTRGLDRVLGTLAEIGYDAEWRVLSAAEFGAPHLRERVIVIAYRHKIMRSILFVCKSPKVDRNEWANHYHRCKERHLRDREPKRLLLDIFQRASIAGLLRVDDGVSDRMDRVGGLGNAVVPQVAEWIGRQIVENYFECT